MSGSDLCSVCIKNNAPKRWIRLPSGRMHQFTVHDSCKDKLPDVFPLTFGEAAPSRVGRIAHATDPHLRECSDCHATFRTEPKRGRPPTRCAACRNKRTELLGLATT